METKELSTIEEIRIYSDPYRMKILSHFQRMDHPATIKEIADKMGEVPAKVYYHAKKLESIGLIYLVSTKEINGINAKYYESFKGAVRIKRDDGADEAAKKIFISETQKLLSDLYDENKRKFLTAQNNDKPYGNLSNSEVYLTEEEAKEFFEWINHFVDEHHARKNSEQCKYDIFTTIAKTIEN
ncbi:helix-turn-helix domain-containing protein [Paenibacillus sp. KQZ6P-2]|uniref:Helix-turn-helix domain-containing protein n=1 Tax=Paenibacillus mangrovi TaxID=2931978 RepID=A0A9X2B3H1_9BACL|nr:helix-turn-helix domain-containing protein [Paenibacillus mangrovi]MCJ8010577.1 helix-turn-helix domain-containing protein [Paenibacillus mangrovi]